MRAGQLRERIVFSKRADTGDAYGNPTAGEFVDQFTVDARVQYLRGTEVVMASRLQSVQPVVITVRRSPTTEQIKGDWRAVDLNNSSRIFNVRSITPSERKEMIDLLCDTGVAV
jgi:SPP1 family predicted phage head-tail adaptor